MTNQDGTNLTGQTIRSFDEFDDEGVSSNSTTGNIASGGTGEGADDKTADAEPEVEVEADGPRNAVESEDIPLYSHGIRWRRFGRAISTMD